MITSILNQKNWWGVWGWSEAGGWVYVGCVYVLVN